MKRFISTLLVACLIPAFTACSNQNDDRIEPTTRTTESMDNRGGNEPNQSIDSTIGTTAETTPETSTEATEPAPTYDITDVDGEYEYTLYAGTPYETTLKMGASFNFFLRDPDGYCGGSTYWRIQEFADYYGWLEDGKYTLRDIEDDSLEDSGTHTIGFSNIYMLPCGDYRCYLEIGYNDEKTGDKGNQIRSITIRFIQNDSMEPAFTNPVPEQMDVVINFADHPDSYKYQCDYKIFGGSYEDIIVLQYVLYTVSQIPGDSSVLFGYFRNPTLENGHWVIDLP